MKDISEKDEEKLFDQEPAEEPPVSEDQENSSDIPENLPDAESDEDFFDSGEDDLDDFDSEDSDDFDMKSPAQEELDDAGEDFAVSGFEEEEPDPAGEEDFFPGGFEGEGPDTAEEDFSNSGIEEEEPDYREDYSAAEINEEEEGPDVFAPERREKDTEEKGGLIGWLKKMPAVKRAAVMAAIGAACALLVFGIVAAVLNSNNKQPAEQAAEDPAEQIVIVQQQVSDVKFLSFGPLSINNEDGYVSVKEFSQILDRLYADGYVLVDIYSIGQADESGSMILNKTIDVPEGRKPLVIMQRDVSYPISRQTDNFARRLVVDADGYIRTEYAESESESAMDDYDLIPLIESFIREHPDFSYNGARGIIGLTGYNGILGYRTSAYLASEEDNPYGTFDTDNQVRAMQGVLETLQGSGWRFASNGFGYRISYGSEYSLVEKDANSWNDQVGSLIGGTDILILPRQTDIGSWAPYDENNTKYTLMRKLGFRFYLIAEDETPGFMLARDEYLRIGVTEINEYSEFEAAFPNEEEQDTAA